MKTARRVRWLAVMGLAVLSAFSAVRNHADATPTPTAHGANPPCVSVGSARHC